MAVDCELSEDRAVFYWSASTKTMIETFVEPAAGGVDNALYIRSASKHHALNRHVYVQEDATTTAENGQADDVERDDENFVQRFLKWFDT